ncbi:hypothetical protein AwWohl_10560 [Gammaproteobacteria bacterium]|nr:hypothetical protein AwWohl_10560 [Gammaproteobacteria bacterium]
MYTVNLMAGWLSFIAGAGSGALIGLQFHKKDWLGGYSSFARRLLRLGHIAFFGIGILNILFAQSVNNINNIWIDYASILFLSAFSMSLVCFLTAWKKPFRHLFFIPAGSTMLAVILTVIGLY